MPDLKVLQDGLFDGDLSKVQQCLDDDGLDINQEIILFSNESVFTPLIWSFININRFGRDKVARAILNHPRCKIFSGAQDPLPYAIKMSVPPDFLDALIEKGVREEGAELETWLAGPVFIRDDEGEMAPFQDRRPLCIAAQCGNLALVKYLIEKRGVPLTSYDVPSSNTTNTTALVSAIERYNNLDNFGICSVRDKLFDVMAYLIDAGVSLDDVTLRDGSTKSLDAFVDEDEVWDHYKKVRQLLRRAIAARQPVMVSQLSTFEPPAPPSSPVDEDQKEQLDLDDSIDGSLNLS